MHLCAIRLKNFRRFRDVCIDLEPAMSIFVGPNNSGKTSAAQAIQLFTATSKEEFSLHDFSSECWPEFASAVIPAASGQPSTPLPRMSLDLWFDVEAKDLHLVMDILPKLDWQGSRVGVRVEFGPSNDDELLRRFREAEAESKTHVKPAAAGGKDYRPWPHDLMDYLEEKLGEEFERRFYVLDFAHFDDSFAQAVDYKPLPLVDTKDPAANEKKRGGLQILRSLIRVDCLHAQRHLADTGSGARAENLSSCLSRFYTRNLTQRPNDYDALRALEESQDRLDVHLATVFASMLKSLAELGYPGVANPRLQIRAALDSKQIFGKDGARVHYELDGAPAGTTPITLPDQYNGLGFKNLIYMVVELLDHQAQWLATPENRPPLHLILIEEPEAHLHVQLQQVFIREVAKLLKLEPAEAAYCTTQLIVTTHSSHITFERGFVPIRYFRRGRGASVNSSEVLNISAFCRKSATPTKDFLQRYMRLTHCDLFFADAAVLVEGPVEKFLLPSIIDKHSPELKTAYLTVLEIGGACGHIFRTLVEFLGLPTLLVTDLDSVARPPAAAPVAGGASGGVDDEDEADKDAMPSTCRVNTPGAVTSNQTLIQWLPKKSSIDALLAATEAERTQAPSQASPACVRVVYQRPEIVTWKSESLELTGRTFEEAFALENLAWCQHKDRRSLHLRIPKNETLGLDELAGKIHDRVRGDSFEKVDFALGVLAHDPAEWTGPRYIADGLKWLSSQVQLTAPPTMQPVAVAAAAVAP